MPSGSEDDERTDQSSPRRQETSSNMTDESDSDTGISAYSDVEDISQYSD
jgi:hypothetical protein